MIVQNLVAGVRSRFTRRRYITVLIEVPRSEGDADKVLALFPVGGLFGDGRVAAASKGRLVPSVRWTYLLYFSSVVSTFLTWLSAVPGYAHEHFRDGYAYSGLILAVFTFMCLRKSIYFERRVVKK